MRDEGARFRPFCSTRCRTIDLGSWLEGHYRVASTADEEEDPTGDIVKPDSDDV